MKAKRIGKILLLIVSISLLTSCSSIDYVGETYPSSQNVEVFYSLEEVPREYRIFGHVVGSGGIFSTENDRFQKIKLEAMNRGADAVVITGIDIEHQDDLEETKKIHASLIKYLE